MKTVLITGKGRSGTTWLAQILNTYVHCAYKHEPFLPSKRNPYSELRDGLTNTSPEVLRARYEEIVGRAIHGVDQPPFPQHKSIRSRDPRVMRALYSIGNRASGLRFLFERFAKPHMHEDADVLIKDVNFPTELLPKLCNVLEPVLVPIVRNPFANIASHLKGVELGQFRAVTPEDRARVSMLLGQQRDPSLRQYRSRLGDLSAVQFEAVRWRLQVEPLIDFARSHARSHLVVYEDLCADPMGVTQDIFDTIGWRMMDSTKSFIEASTSGARRGRSKAASYYSVYRDPSKSLEKWREQLTAVEQNDIASIFVDSPHTGLWRNLPVRRLAAAS